MRPVSKSEFARERGFSRTRLYQLIEDGRVKPIPEGALHAGMIDADEAHKILDAQLDQSKGRDTTTRSPALSSPPAGPAAAAPGAPAPDLLAEEDAPPASDSDARDDYWDSRARREAAEATRSEMKALQEAGALVAADAVRKEAYETARHLRNALLEIPDRISAVLDPANPARAHKLLTDELGKVLRDYGKRLEERAAADTGAAEADGAALQSVR